MLKIVAVHIEFLEKYGHYFLCLSGALLAVSVIASL